PTSRTWCWRGGCWGWRRPSGSIGRSRQPVRPRDARTDPRSASPAARRYGRPREFLFGLHLTIHASPVDAKSVYEILGAQMPYEDILYDKRDGVATVTINRPNVLNAFRARTVDEMLEAVKDADYDNSVGVIVLAGAGDRAFCSGGDNSSRDGGY